MGDLTLYKLTDPDGSPIHGGSGAWGLPRGSRPGRWRREPGPLDRHCGAGVLHLARARDLPAWVKPGAVVWEAETRGEIREADQKVIALDARLVRRVGVLDEVMLRLWACDCAERVLPLSGGECPGDLRPRQAIEVARRYARGEATLEELDAARAAAWDAAWDAAWAATGAARAAARDAARAARAAAWEAARAAAWDAERQWQGERLLAYLRGEVSDG